MTKNKLPDFCFDPAWIKLKKDMGIELSKKEIEVLNKTKKERVTK